MKYCVIKNTTTVIDGSENPTNIMLQNAISAGFVENEIEIMTEEEYKARKALEPIPPQPPTAEERLTAIEEALLMII
jgi:hypothetical protein